MRTLRSIGALWAILCIGSLAYADILGGPIFSHREWYSNGPSWIKRGRLLNIRCEAKNSEDVEAFIYFSASPDVAGAVLNGSISGVSIVVRSEIDSPDKAFIINDLPSLLLLSFSPSGSHILSESFFAEYAAEQSPKADQMIKLLKSAEYLPKALVNGDDWNLLFFVLNADGSLVRFTFSGHRSPFIVSSVSFSQLAKEKTYPPLKMIR